MADEIRVTTAGTVEREATLPGGGAAAGANDPRAAREQIEATRARMSGTIDEIEDVLLRKKEEIQDRLDFLAPVRERPVQVLGAVFGAGLLLGLLTGGDDDEDEEEQDGRRSLDAWERAVTWEDRSRRLLRIARDQEAELELLRSRLGARETDHPAAEEFDDEPGRSVFDRLRDLVMQRLTGVVEDSVHRMMRV